MAIDILILTAPLWGVLLLGALYALDVKVEPWLSQTRRRRWRPYGR